MPPAERGRVLELLEVRATVTGWEPCPACGGRGKVPGGAGGVVCHSCMAMRRIPHLRIEGVVVDDLTPGGSRLPAAPLPAEASVPFRLHAAVG